VHQVASDSPQPDMFTMVESDVEVPVHPVIAELETIQADDLTPKQALDLLYKLKELSKN
jgi:DNA mismatch repair protein MutS